MATSMIQSTTVPTASSETGTNLGAWALAHYEEPFYSQRTAKIPQKLEQLGVLELDRGARILDAGCGKGEALSVLHRFGFRNLTGADVLPHPEWKGLETCRFEVCDVRRTPFENNEFDAIINLHALHHMGSADGVSTFLEECFRILKPGGELFILDYSGSLQIRVLHWFLRHRIGTITAGLQNFARIQDEEWSFLGPYLRTWPETYAAISRARLQLARWKKGFWLYYLVLTKPVVRGRSTASEADHMWTENYVDPRQHRRRKLEMRAKLERIGVSNAPRDAHIYDLCCGMGEALETLHEMGFQNLHGVDLTLYGNLGGDHRFDVIQADARDLPVRDGCADWIINIHSLHHLETAESAGRFIDECYRILKPGGRLGIVDFPNSLQIRLAFLFLHLNPFRVTPYLRWFGRLVDTEWHFLPGYLADWPAVRKMLYRGRFRFEENKQGLFYFHLRLSKPEQRE